MSGGLSQRHRKWLGWAGIVARFGSAQLVIQVLGFFSGILIVHHLDKPNYAWFTIANTFAAAIGMLADSGVGGALSSIGGTVWQDNARLGSLIRTGLSVRRQLAVWSTVLVTPLFVWMLLKNKAPIGTIAVVVPAALAGFLFQLTAGVLNVVIALRQQIRRMQTAGLALAAMRLGLLAPACLWFIDARVAVIAGTIAGGWYAWFLRRWVRRSVDLHAPPSDDYRARIMAIVKKQAPLTIWHCIQAQIIVWLISIFGNEDRVAEVGALGRFAVLFTIILSVMNSIVVPRFARCQDRATLRRRYWQAGGAFALLAGALVVLSALFPWVLLGVIGAKYANLESEVWLMMLNAGLGSMFICLVSLTYSKGWIMPAAINIPLDIVTQVVLISVLDLSTVRGVLLIGCFSYVPGILLNMVVARREFARLPSAGSA